MSDTATDGTGEIRSLVNLFEADTAAIGRAMAKLGEKVGTYQNVDAFARDAKGYFEDAGFVVEVMFNEVRGVMMPIITVVRRVEPQGEFDHDRKRHEIIHGRGPGGEKGEGLLGADGRRISPPKSVSLHHEGDGPPP